MEPMLNRSVSDDGFDGSFIPDVLPSRVHMSFYYRRIYDE
jgi:hypothetical protein